MTRGPGLSRRAVGLLVAAMLLLGGSEVGGTLAFRRAVDAGDQVSADRLATALVSFRPPNRSGQRLDVSATDLSPQKAVRTAPARCSALTLLTTRLPHDGQSWTGINGNPAQPVTTLTARFDTADQARAELDAKQLALFSCRRVSLVFPPFDKPAQSFTVKRRWRDSFRTDRVGYSLSTADKRYVFYVRRYVNTLTWTYGDPDGQDVRREVVDDLAARLGTLR